MLPGPMELALILVLVMVFFGAGKLPQVMESMGKGIAKFKAAQSEDPSQPVLTTASAPDDEVSRLRDALARAEAAQQGKDA
ncbi:MAG: hypothetical protein RLZZ383_677 [Pseudomonadota bacterium]|jgi:sec-independent protein translocase protein TatA